MNGRAGGGRRSAEVSTLAAGAEAASASGRLRKDAVGTADIVFFVVAAAAPLSGIVLGFPVIVSIGNGVGAAGAYLVATLILLVFAVGFTAMSRHVTNAGAFYAYVAQGLGRPLGLGAATLAIFAYTAIQAGMYGAFGVYGDRLVSEYLGISLPWWIYSVAAMAVCLALGVRQVELGARILGVMLILETSIIVVLDAAILFSGGVGEGGGGGLSLAPFAPTAIFSGAIGVALMFAHAAFIGFEATAIYGEESRDPRRTVPRATYVSVTLMGLFFAVSAWLILNSFGLSQAVARAQDDPEGFAFAAVTGYLGQTATEVLTFLIITSIFAALLAFHNTVARYLYALGRQNLIWSGLGRTHPTRQSPYVACVAQTAIAAAVVGVFAILGRDPFTELFVWATGLGAVGIILLQATASIAVFAFFRRRDVDKRIWNTIVAPILGTAGLLTFIAFAMSNFKLLTGAQGSFAVVFMNVLLWGSGLVGVVWALWMRRSSPESYERVGALLRTDAAEITSHEGDGGIPDSPQGEAKPHSTNDTGVPR